MIPPFSCKPIPSLVFGPGRLSELPTLLTQYGPSILVVTGSYSLINGPFWPPLAAACHQQGFTLHLEQIAGEPSPGQIDAIWARYPADSIDAVVAIGGGSVLDAGKAISAMLVERKSLFTLLEGVGRDLPSGAKIPFIAVPTTSGTGSEATSNAVLSEIGADGYKKSLRHDKYVPDIALIDPQLTLSCPALVTAACGMDSFSQLTEAYLSTNSSPFSDALALDGIRAIARSLRRACQEGSNLEARSDLAYASYLSGIVLANAGLGAVHGLAGPLGGLFPIPHGVACGLLMAPVNHLTLNGVRKSEECREPLLKYQRLGTIFGSRLENPGAADHFIMCITELARELLPVRLQDFGIDRGDIDSIVAQGANKFNPVNLTDEEFAWALDAVI